jgi:hypothetical protein
MVSAPCSDNSATCAVRAMALPIRGLILEAHETLDRFWFVRAIDIVVISAMAQESRFDAPIAIDYTLHLKRPATIFISRGQGLR